MPAFRAAVIGCGFFGRFHLHSWRDLGPNGVQLSAICDTDPARAEAAAKEFGVPSWYSDPAAMLATESLDLVDIATRMDTHRELAEMSIAAAFRPSCRNRWHRAGMIAWQW
jgi:D-apiose dehydrogenase